jgi:hypothetical protein
MPKKTLVLQSLVVLSSLVAVAHNPALAAPAADTLGTYRDTSNANEWMVKYLGTSDDWEAERNYTNSILDMTGYVQAQVVYHPWETWLPWISPGQDADGLPGTYEGLPGYYSYVTTINDASITGADPTLLFSGLSISFAADDLLYAFVVNGVTYDGFTAQTDSSVGGYENLFIPSGGNISWNLGGNNMVEVIVHNYDMGYSNPTGFSATIQASYAPIPEPETWAMLLAGLGIVGAVTRRQRTRTVS